MGKIISFSGIDGAGKTTQVSILEKFLKNKELSFLTTEKFFGYLIFKPLIKYFRKATSSPRSGPVSRNQNPFLKLWFIPAFIDIWISYLFYARKLLAKYEVVIADRFYHDIWTNLIYYGYAPEWAFSLVRFLPKSDLPFVFVVKPNTVVKREDDFPLSYYKEQSELYDQLERYITLFTINADKTKKEAFAQIKELLKQEGI